MRVIPHPNIRLNGTPPRLLLTATSPAAGAGAGAVAEDCNSNTNFTSSPHAALNDTTLDSDALCDNSGYLWFHDYCPFFRDGGCQPPSVLTSVSAPYKGISELAAQFQFTSQYNDIARDLDANLAEADIESFKTKDIHALLTTTNLTKDLSVRRAITEKMHADDESVGSMNTMSMYKSELLFSPVKDATFSGVHYSVDSLDCELPTEQELILTCQANKHNYIIAFEGSVTACSEDSECDDSTVSQKHDIGMEENVSSTRRNLELLKKCKLLTNKLTASMARSDLCLTTWSKLKDNCQTQPMRLSSINNNEDAKEICNTDNDFTNSIIKSQSLPNLCGQRLITSSISSTALSNSTVDSFTINQKITSIPTCMKVYDVMLTNQGVTRSHGSQHSEPMSTSSIENQSSSDKSQPKHQFNLVKLFMKQKSLGSDCNVAMDLLDRSECWPSSSGGESGESIADHKIRDDSEINSNSDHTTDVDTAWNIGSLINKTPTIKDANTKNEISLDNESNLYTTIDKLHEIKNNVNNNITNSPSRLKNNYSRKSHSSQSSATSVSISSCSESDRTQIIRINKMASKYMCDKKIHTKDQSMQTSNLSTSNISNERNFIKFVEPSFLEKLKRGDCEKPVYVLYPNYTLPDVSFLSNNPNIHMSPIKVNLSKNSTGSTRTKYQAKGKRPFSCNDIEMLRKKGFSHIKDWDSLNFLLPTEFKQFLAEVPELTHLLKEKDEYFNNSPLSNKSKRRPMSCDCYNIAGHNNAVSSSSSTATQPSSGYRGSSTSLADTSTHNIPALINNFNPLLVHPFDSTTSSDASGIHNEIIRTNNMAPKRLIHDPSKAAKELDFVPPRPPLPKSILRKTADKSRKTGANIKRYSKFELEDYAQDPIIKATAKAERTRRRPETFYFENQHLHLDFKKNNDIAAKLLSEEFLDAAEKDDEYGEYYQDEGVGTESSLESGKSNEIKYHRSPPLPKPRTKKIEYAEFPPPGSLISNEDLQQLEEFLKLSGVNCQNMNDWDLNQVQKSKNLTVPRISEEVELTPDEIIDLSRDNSKIIDLTRDSSNKFDMIDISHKRAMVSSLTDAVEKLILHFAPAHDQAELTTLGDSRQSPACAKIVLNALCPSLYAILRDGLKENIETSFGPVNNSVWQMVEAMARQGPITESLNELVLRINSEEAITEGLVKFNAFVLGLLNAKSLDAFISYIRTRESVLQRHYSNDSLPLAACAGEPQCRKLLDYLVMTLEPLSLLPFSLDLLFEMREVHQNFKRIDRDIRAVSGQSDPVSDDDHQTAGPGESGSGGKFKLLRLKWELLSNITMPQQPTQTSPVHTGSTQPLCRGSKIPRPVFLPVRPQSSIPQNSTKTTNPGIPVSTRKPGTLRSPQSAAAGVRVTTGLNKATAQPAYRKVPGSSKISSCVTKNVSILAAKNRTNNMSTKTSRMDQPAGHGSNTPRPTSLQYGRAIPTPAARHASSPPANRVHKTNKLTTHKYVRTLWHRLPSDTGHLAFNEGERLRLILEVDNKHLLCCRGDQKGLVPRDAVILEDF